MTQDDLRAEILRFFEECDHTKKAVADALHVHPQQAARIIEIAQGGGELHPEIDTCLYLAAAIRRAPREVLEVAGHGDVANLIEQFYGTPLAQPQQRPLSAEDRAHLDRWHQLPAAIQLSLVGFFDALVAWSAPARTRRQQRTAEDAEARGEAVPSLRKDFSDLERAAREQSPNRPKPRPRGRSKRPA